MRKIFALLIVVMLVFAVSGVAYAQQQDDEKVIKTTTDSRGFETRHTEVDLMIQTAKALMDAKEYAKAAAEYEKVLAKDSSRLDALHDLGNCYKSLGQYDKAAVAYARAVRSNPGDERLLINLAYFQIRSKDIDGATATYKQLLEKDPDNYDAHKGLGYIYEKTKQNDKALEHYTAAVRLRPTDYKTMGSIAKIYDNSGQTDKAMEEYERLIESAPPEVALDYKAEVGAMYIKQQNFQKSAWLFHDLCEAQPDKYTHHYNYGISLLQLNRPNDAAPELQKAEDLNPDFCPTYRMLAQAYEESGRYNESVRTVQKGLGVCKDNNAGLYYEWGRALEGLKRYDEAILKFEMAVSDPTFGEVAKRQIKRQQDLMKRAQAMQNQ